MEKSWLDERYAWLDETGRPKHEDWKTCQACSSGDVKDMGFIEPCIVDAKFTADYTVVRGGKEIRMPVIDLDFDGSDIFQAELLDEMTKNPKERRLERRLETAKKMKELKGTKKPVKKRKRQIEYAIADLDAAWFQGFAAAAAALQISRFQKTAVTLS